MLSLLRWIRNCFRNLIFGKEIKEELVTKINNVENKIPENVKQDLLASIVANDPQKFVEQIHDGKNQLTDKAKSDLMQSILKASKQCVPIVEPEQVCESSEKPAETKVTATKPVDYSDMPRLEEINKENHTPPTEGYCKLRKKIMKIYQMDECANPRSKPYTNNYKRNKMNVLKNEMKWNQHF
jgi:hypothetical protein